MPVVIMHLLAFHGTQQGGTKMMGMHGLGGVQEREVLWLAQRNDSLHIRFGESEKSWKALSREQIRQLSSFRQPAMD